MERSTHPTLWPTPAATLPKLIQLAGADLIHRSEVRQRWPILAELVERAALQAPGPACRHVLAGVRRGVVRCAQHPTDGLWCADCIGGHVARHTRQDELACDNCGALHDLICPRAFLHPAPARARDLAGRKRSIPGPVLLLSLGLCRDCCDLPNHHHSTRRAS